MILNSKSIVENILIKYFSIIVIDLILKFWHTVLQLLETLEMYFELEGSKEWRRIVVHGDVKKMNFGHVWNAFC